MYEIGDLVSVKYCHVENEQLKFRVHTGIVTDRAGATDGTGEYKVHTVDGKHDWQIRDDMVPAIR